MTVIEYKPASENVAEVASVFSKMGLKLMVRRTSNHIQPEFLAVALTDQDKRAYFDSTQQIQLQKNLHINSLSACAPDPDIAIFKLYQLFAAADGRKNCVIVPSGINQHYKIFKADAKNQPVETGNFSVQNDVIHRLELDF